MPSTPPLYARPARIDPWISGGDTTARLIGQIYLAAPGKLRLAILDHLLRPLGTLSIVGVAGGVFAGIWSRQGWRELRLHLEDTQVIHAVHVVALVQHVAQLRSETIAGLVAQLLSTPVLVTSSRVARMIGSLAQALHAPAVATLFWS